MGRNTSTELSAQLHIKGEPGSILASVLWLRAQEFPAPASAYCTLPTLQGTCSAALPAQSFFIHFEKKKNPLLMAQIIIFPPSQSQVFAQGTRGFEAEWLTFKLKPSLKKPHLLIFIPVPIITIFITLNWTSAKRQQNLTNLKQLKQKSDQAWVLIYCFWKVSCFILFLLCSFEVTSEKVSSKVTVFKNILEGIWPAHSFSAQLWISIP